MARANQLLVIGWPQIRFWKSANAKGIQGKDTLLEFDLRPYRFPQLRRSGIFIATNTRRLKPHRGGISGSMPLLRSFVLNRLRCYKYAAPPGLKKTRACSPKRMWRYVVTPIRKRRRLDDADRSFPYLCRKMVERASRHVPATKATAFYKGSSRGIPLDLFAVGKN